MFKSDRTYKGLDDYSGTSAKGNVMSWDNVNDRIHELDKLYTKWNFNYWKFNQKNDINQFLRNEIYDVIELMRSSSNNYIIANFEASIILASAAVEKMCNAVLFIYFMREKKGTGCNSIDPEWIKVDTVNGPIYFDKQWNRVIKIGNAWFKFKNNTLNEKTLEKVKCYGYSCEFLLNPGDQLEKSIFVERRNAVAHGDPARMLIIEQLHGYVINTPNDMAELMNNRKSAFDQYKMASTFILSVFSKFDKDFPPKGINP